MIKTIVFTLVPFLLFVGSPTYASVKDWENEKNRIAQERKEIKDKLPKANEKEKIKLVQQDNKLAAYHTAYEAAIGYVEIDKKEPQSTTTDKTVSFSFFPTKLLPGQKVPTEYIPIYKGAGERFGVDWFVLAAIHDIETDFSRLKTMVSSVGAEGHMQFMPSTFSAYAIDGNNDGVKSAWNLEDSIYSAANYLSKSGYKKDIRKAIWHYNHAEWYINDVLEIAGRIKSE
ncbi:lytic transglycosylase domain-containing protein [Peribacillus sp. TH24]|uniref:lytic transglycosylase domain-containing protein n=1 Tax=Peribacillus sp. TH24 TaxID=2798483 RepID=UPI001F5BBD6A|nr:lytic transglycosylase domain-containing protein [Peribacillus sp. TH24]